ncbi:MAG TPA: sulfite exporter TauE/SafE family protein [Actinomycetes bacterium]|nr:sulfite exporter TauE/SafE family protein [Actinomycetes bacterium]
MRPFARPGRGTATWPRRAVVLAALAAALAVAGAAPAAAHPLGNFTVNSYSGLRVGPDRLVVDYVLDLAEIPAFQARQAIDGDRDGTVSGAEAAGWRDRECPRLASGLRATVNGRALPLQVRAANVAFPPGVGGLSTMRLECALAARLPAGGGVSRLAYADGNQAGRVGWREVTATGDGATLEATDVPASSASARLTAYPEDQLRSPLDQRTATVSFRPGGPRAGQQGGTGAVAAAARGGVDRATAAFTALVAERRLSPGFGLLALALAVALGAAHALAPGHGKTVMAAYLVGLRGTLRQAATIGATVTVTHTAGVLLLGLLLSASRAVASERVYPWLGLASGLLLAAVGLTLAARALRGHRHPHPHDHPHEHGPGGHAHTGSGAGRPLGRRGLVALGLAGGLVPSPSAVVVLLGGIALGHTWFGVALVLAYGVGMAATLTGVGLLLAHLRTRVDRRLSVPAGSLLARAGRLLPVATASVIVAVGLALAAQGAAQL